MNDKLIYTIEDAEKSLIELTGAEYQHKKVGTPMVHGYVQEGIRALREVKEHLWKEKEMKTFLVINGENSDPVSYYKHLGNDFDLQKELKEAVEELGIHADESVFEDIERYLSRCTPYWLDETWCFTMV
jgi:hypothetical protein